MAERRGWRPRPSTTRSPVALWAKSLLNAALFFLVFMVALPWGAHWLVPAALPVPRALAAPAGAGLFLLGIGVWLWGLDAFSRRGGGTPFPLDAPRELVSSGPFRYVRNPIMAAELVVIWGEALWFASAGILLYAAAISAGAHLVLLRVEEPELRERFGEAWDAYARRVPRWLPRLGRTR